MDSGLVVPVFNQGDDPIACLNKAMYFLTVLASLRVIVQQIQGSQGQSYAGKGHMARQCTQKKRLRNAAWFKEKEMLAEVREAGQILDEEQLAFLADPGIPDGKYNQTTIPNTAAFQTKDIHAYDSNCNDVSTAKAVLMANISNYGLDVISEQIDSFEQNLSNHIKENESLLQTFTVFKNESKNKESKYLDKEIDLEKEIKELYNIVYKVDFGKCFVPQQELYDEQTFWLQTSHPNIDQSASSPVKIEAPRELPKVNLVNTSLEKLKYLLGQFDTVTKKRITPDAITEGEWRELTYRFIPRTGLSNPIDLFNALAFTS
nr:hypothetical protein [Tanacetum cinerariifolium]